MKLSIMAWTTAAVLGVIGPATALAFSPTEASQASVAPGVVPAPADSESPVATPSSIKSEVLVLYASNDGSGIDKKIPPISALGKPPFSSYNSYALLDDSELPIDLGKSADKQLPDTTKLTLTFNSVTISKPKDGEKPELLFTLTESIMRTDGSAVLPSLQVKAKRGEYFFLAGTKYKDGILVIGVRVE